MQVLVMDSGDALTAQYQLNDANMQGTRIMHAGINQLMPSKA